LFFFLKAYGSSESPEDKASSLEADESRFDSDKNRRDSTNAISKTDLSNQFIMCSVERARRAALYPLASVGYSIDASINVNQHNDSNKENNNIPQIQIDFRRFSALSIQSPGSNYHRQSLSMNNSIENCMNQLDSSNNKEVAGSTMGFGQFKVNNSIANLSKNSLFNATQVGCPFASSICDNDYEAAQQIAFAAEIDQQMFNISNTNNALDKCELGYRPKRDKNTLSSATSNNSENPIAAKHKNNAISGNTADGSIWWESSGQSVVQNSKLELTDCSYLSTKPIIKIVSVDDYFDKKSENKKEVNLGLKGSLGK
jgi:hypothetical protein